MRGDVLQHVQRHPGSEPCVWHAPKPLPCCDPFSATTPFRRLRRGPRRRRARLGPLWREYSRVALAWTARLISIAKLERLGLAS
eukprot:1485439-Pyramimonas_sp.AAC.1